MKKFLTGLFVLLAGQVAIAQSTGNLSNAKNTGIIKGKITTTEGEAIPLATVFLKNSPLATTADEYGFFVLKNIQEGSYTLVASFTGLASKEQAVTIAAGKTLELNLALAASNAQLQEVIVNGRRSINETPIAVGKLPVSPMDLPQSVSIVGQGVIRDQQALRLSDVIKNVNGVYLATTRGNTQEAFSARGYSFSSNNMFKNGTRVNSGAMPEVSSLERVEILKGSAAILYGNVAPGGILNMVTKQPKFKAGGEVSMRAGSYDLYKPAVDVYGPISSHIAYRINGTYEYANSFRDVVNSKRYYVNPSLLFKIGKNTELLVQGDYLRHNFTPDFGIGSVDNTQIANLPRNTFLGTAWQYAKTEQATAGASIKHRVNDAWSVNGAVSYQRYKRDYYSTERIQAQANGDWVRPLNKTKTVEDYYTAAFDVTGKFKTGRFAHVLLTGVDADRYNTSAYTYNQPTTYDTINIYNLSKYKQRRDIPAATAIRLLKTPINRFGAYVQDLISVSEKLKVLAGIRWSIQEGLPPDTTNLLTNARVLGVHKTDKAFSPRFGIVYKFTANTALFASYANSFTVNTGTDVYGNAVSPSIIDQFEVGIKNDLLKNRLSVNVTAYRIVNNNLAQTAPFKADGVTPNNDTNIKLLTGQTTSDGVEVDIAGHPSRGLDIIAGYSYNYARYTKTADTKGSYTEGERLVNNPAHTANASVFYSFGTTRLKGLKIGAAGFYTGDRFGGWNNTRGQTQNYSRLIAVKGFSTFDISAGYTWKKVALLAKLSNVTNTYSYYVHENYSINPIPPRQVMATVSYSF
jgi:iron complex outermembrane receptor protein